MKLKKQPPKKPRNYLHLENIIKRKGAGSGSHGKKGYTRKVKHKGEV
jgi:hypothetical protein